jgi:hypothetical protein
MGNVANTYRAVLTKEDVIGQASLVLTLNEFTKIGQKVVAADELLGMGYGVGENQDNAAGRLFCDFKDAVPALVTGIFRIMMMSSQDMPIGMKPVIIDIDTRVLAFGSTDRGGQIPFPFQNVLLSKDKKYVFYIKNIAAAAQTLTKANCTVSIDVTKQLV